MEKLNTLLKTFEETISEQEKLDITISKSNIGWHIEHIFLTTSGIIDLLKKSNPEEYKWSFKIPRFVVFTIKKIPRGKAKAPKKAIHEIYNEETLREKYKIVKSKIQELNDISKDKYFTHPFFGDLKLKQTITFLEIHAEHHLKIIQDILKSGKQL